MERKYVLAIEEYLERLEKSNEEILSHIKQLKEKVDSLEFDNKPISSKVRAAEYLECDPQFITTLIDEGRIVNYGRGTFFLFHKDELNDVSEVIIK